MTAQIVKANWYKYDESGANPTTACESGAYYYFYDALGNVNGVLEEKNGLYHYYKWEMDAFGNDLPGGNDFLAMDQSGPKEHLTGKMYDTVTDLYYFHARWYDPEAGRFMGRDPISDYAWSPYIISHGNPNMEYDANGAMPSSGEKSVCNITQLTDEWKKIQQSAKTGHETNNYAGYRACGTRASVIAKEIGRQSLCCYDVAVMTRSRFPTFNLLVHTVTVVRVKAEPANHWDYLFNEVIDDWQLYTALIGWGYLDYYDMRGYLNEYPYFVAIYPNESFL